MIPFHPENLREAGSSTRPNRSREWARRAVGGLPADPDHPQEREPIPQPAPHGPARKGRCERAASGRLQGRVDPAPGSWACRPLVRPGGGSGPLRDMRRVEEGRRPSFYVDELMISVLTISLRGRDRPASDGGAAVCAHCSPRPTPPTPPLPRRGAAGPQGWCDQAEGGPQGPASPSPPAERGQEVGPRGSPKAGTAECRAGSPQPAAPPLALSCATCIRSHHPCGGT